MTDEEIDAEIAAITEDEARVSEAEAAQEEMGYDEETIEELKAQTGTPDRTARREAIIRNQRNRYKSLTERANQAAEAEPVSPEPSTKTPPAKPVKYNTPERKEARREKVKDIATGTTKEQRDAEAAVEQNKANVDAMDVETFIEENYKDAPEKEKEGIREVWKRLRDRTPLKITGNILEFASRVEKKFGVKIDFVESLDGERSGEITGNRIKVARDATTGDVVRSVILHELTHKAEGGGKLYDRLSKMILDMKYGGDQDAMNEDIKQKVADYSAYYKAQNRTDEFTDAEAKQEIVADYMGEIVNGNEAMIERLVRDDKTLAQKIRNIIHDVIDKFTGVKDPQIDQMKKAVRMLDKAIRKADKGGANDEVKYSKAGENNAEISHIKDQIRERQDELNKMSVVASVSAPDFSQMNAKSRKAWVLDGLRDTGYRVDRNGFGVIEFGEKQIDTSLEYTNTPAEVAAFLAVPRILKRGIEINRHDDHKSRGFSTVTFAGPVEINGKKGNMAVVVKRLGRNLYKTHRILMPDGSVFAYETKKAEPTPAGGATIGPHAQRISSADSIISENVAEINRNIEKPEAKYSLPSQNALEAQILAWQKAHQAEIDAAAENDGVSQFATQTIQNAKHVPEQVKKLFSENRYLNGYKKDTNADQIDRAMNNIDQNGYDAEVSRLLDADYFSAEDTVEAGAIAISAFEEEDVATGLEMALKYRVIGSEQAQSFQSRKLFSEMSPTHVAMRVGGDVEAQLQKVMNGQPNLAEKVNKRAEKKAKELEGLDMTDKLKEINKQSSFTVSDMLDAHDRKYGVPTNESQRKAIKQYGLGKIERPGIHYNRATQEQRMLEFILATPDLTANTGNGITGLQRLEWMREGKPVVTSVDVRYITERIKEYCKLSPYDKGTRAGDIALGRAFEAFRNCSPATFKEKHKAYRYLNMLTTLTSPGKNVIGNTGQNAVNAAVDETAVLFVDWLTGKVTKKREHAHVPVQERINSFLEFRDEIANTFRDYFIDKVDTSPAEQGEISLEKTKRGRTFGGSPIGEALNGIQNVEGFLMSFGDRTFYKQAYFNSLAEQKALADRNGVELDWNEAVEQAKADADYATFNESNGIRKVIQAIRGWNPVAEFIVNYTLPFIGIPTNMLKRGFIEYTPVGVIPALAKMASDAKAGRRFDQRAFVEAMARSGIAGSILVGLGFKLAASGFYSAGTSEEDDEKLYNLRAAMGEQYSPFVRVGDEYVNLNIIAPLIYPITIGATIYDLMKNKDATLLEGIGGASVAMLNQLYDASFMSAVGDIVSGIRDSDLLTSGVKAISQSVLSQNLPLSGLMNQIADWHDPYQRDTKDENTLEGVLKEAVKKTISRIPVLREKLLNPKYDITGSPARSRDGVYDNFINPLSTTKANDDPVLKELMRLNEATDSSSHIPTFMIKKSGKVQILADIADDWNVNMDRSAGEHKLTLTADERSRYNQMYSKFAFDGTGDTYYETVGKNVEGSFTGIRDYMNSWEYQNATDGERAKEISNILAMAKRLTQSQIVIEKGYRMY